MARISFDQLRTQQLEQLSTLIGDENLEVVKRLIETNPFRESTAKAIFDANIFDRDPVDAQFNALFSGLQTAGNNQAAINELLLSLGGNSPAVNTVAAQQEAQKARQAAGGRRGFSSTIQGGRLFLSRLGRTDQENDRPFLGG